MLNKWELSLKTICSYLFFIKRMLSLILTGFKTKTTNFMTWRGLNNNLILIKIRMSWLKYFLKHMSQFQKDLLLKWHRFHYIYLKTNITKLGICNFYLHSNQCIWLIFLLGLISFLKYSLMGTFELWLHHYYFHKPNIILFLLESPWN